MLVAIPPHLSTDVFAGRRRGGTIVTLGGATMGTRWSARVVDPPEQCLAAIEDVLARVVGEMSNWEPQSAISRFNRTPVGQWMALPPAMLRVLHAGLAVAELSEGSFDPAIGSLVDHWGFGPGTSTGWTAVQRPVVPSWTAIEVRDGGARRMADVALDFSGIAKGFAVDAVIDALAALGIANALVEIGGELRGIGVKPDIQPWWVDVEVPPGLETPPLRLALSGAAVATSGDYRRYRMEGGRRISHSIDPKTAAPVATDIASVTVVHDSAMLADAWATAILVLGWRRGVAMATRHKLAARLIVRSDDGAREYMTPAMAAMLE